MFVDEESRHLPEPWRPNPPRPHLTPRQQRVMMWIIGFNLVMLLFGPLAGTTLLEAVWALFAR